MCTRLSAAGSMANLRAAYGTADSVDHWRCRRPCAHQDTDGRLYIRFQRPHPGKYSFGRDVEDLAVAQQSQRP